MASSSHHGLRLASVAVPSEESSVRLWLVISHSSVSWLCPARRKLAAASSATTLRI